MSLAGIRAARRPRRVGDFARRSRIARLSRDRHCSRRRAPSRPDPTASRKPAGLAQIASPRHLAARQTFRRILQLRVGDRARPAPWDGAASGFRGQNDQQPWRGVTVHRPSASVAVTTSAFTKKPSAGSDRHVEDAAPARLRRRAVQPEKVNRTLSWTRTAWFCRTSRTRASLGGALLRRPMHAVQNGAHEATGFNRPRSLRTVERDARAARADARRALRVGASVERERDAASA